ncbi:MAG: GNAT family N-acetyltransferase [Anaerolineae bacterium]
MDPNSPKLVSLTSAMQPEFVELLRDYTLAGTKRYEEDLAAVQKDYPAFLQRLEDESQGKNLAPGNVAQSTYWLQAAGGSLLGGIRLRYTLTPLLAHEAGHIGYDIRPSMRGLGFGTTQLGLLLPIARERGLDHVLITCKRDNLASARIIEKNGGQLENEVSSWRYADTWFRRYWITLIDITEAHP